MLGIAVVLYVITTSEGGLNHIWEGVMVSPHGFNPKGFRCRDRGSSNTKKYRRVV